MKIALLALVPFLSPVDPVNAPAQVAAEVAAPQRATPAVRYTWTGTTLGANGSFGEPPDIAITVTKHGDKSVTTRANPRQRAEEHLTELARIELSIDVDRELDQARARLDELWVRAARKREYDGRFEVLERIALARAQLAKQRAGDEAALAELLSLLPDERVKTALGARFELEPADASLVELETKSLASPALLAARARFQGAGSNGAPSKGVAGDDGLEESIRAALSSDSPRLITDLGSRAAPALERIALESPQQLNVRPEFDPVRLLYTVDPLRALHFFREKFDAGGGVWHWRMAQALVTRDLLSANSSWMVPTYDDAKAKPNTCALDDLMPLVERLTADESARSVALSLVGSAAKYNGLTPALQETLARYIQDTDAPLRDQVFSTLQGAVDRSTVRPVIEAGLKSADPGVRRRCAEHLANRGPSPALDALASDADPDVRALVARSYTRKSLETRDYASASDYAVVKQLARDPHGAVRLAAAYAVIKAPRPLAKELYVRLAQDSDPQVVRAFAGDLDVEAPAQVEVLEALAESEATIEAYDRRLKALRESSADPSDEWAVPFLRGFARRITVGQIRDAWKDNDFHSALHRFMRTEDGMRAVSAAVATRNDPELWKAWFESLPFVVRDERVPAGMHAIDPRHLETALRHWLVQSNIVITSLVQNIRASVSPNPKGGASAAARALEQLPAWRALALDASRSVLQRAFAASIAVANSDAELEAALQVLLSDPHWILEGNAGESDAWQWLPRALPALFLPARREAFLARLFQDPGVNVNALSQIASGMRSDAWTPALALALLERWAANPDDLRTTNLANPLFALPTRPDARVVAVLEKLVHESGFAPKAAEYMGRNRQPEFVPILAACLDPTWLKQRDEVQKAAAAALTSYMTEEAAEHLLRGVTLAVGPEGRDACLAGVEQIRKYLEEKKRWAARSSDGEKRISAVKELVTLLSDNDAATRAQAARGLATLNATEELPRLVQLLKDKSADVRNAAQQALDALSAKSKQE